jgi:hypothetical protein
LWARATGDGSSRLRRGKAEHWAAATKNQVAKGYAKWLSYLWVSDQLDPEQIPSHRVTEERIESYVAWLEDQKLASTTIASRVSDLREAIRVMEENPDLSLLSEVLSTLCARQEVSRDKHARLVHPREAWERARGFLEELPSLPCPNELIRATWYRDGLAAAFLARRPIRLKNLTSLRIGQNLIRTASGWRCSFEAAEIKDRRPQAFELPADLEALIDRYIEVHRPILLAGQTSDHLWISTRRGTLSQQALYVGICNATEKLFGRPINPHLFRDCAATTIATEDPNYVLASARILGHGSIRTTERSYNHSKMAEAMERFHEALIELKHENDADQDTIP